MSGKKVIIIGAGIGGLASANLLAKAGYDVHIFEAHGQAGGRAGSITQDGFRFDTGPSWYLMPDVFKHYYELLGQSVDDWLDLQRLTPGYKVFFQSQPAVTITSDLTIDSQTFEAIETGAGKALQRYVRRGDKIYQLSLQHFLYSNFERLRDFMHPTVLRNGLQMLRLASQSIDRYVGGFVRDRRLQQILEYPMVFLGTSPFTAPAIYSLMSALDFKEGVFYPRGGMYTIIESLVSIGRSLGVTYHYNAPVDAITSQDGAVTGIRLSDGTAHAATVVVSNADLHHTETRLLDEAHQSYPQRYWDGKQPGPSALLLSLGVRGGVPELEHHNLLFVDDWKQNFAAIYNDKTIPTPASIYISRSSATDASAAPEGDENIFILVPLPAGLTVDEVQIRQLREQYLQQIKDMTGVDLSQRTVTERTFGPNDFVTEFHAWQATMLGQSHKLTQSAFFRTPNKSKKLSGLYYVGGNTMPGIGLPMCLISAELLYKRLAGDHQGGPVERIKQLTGKGGV